MGANALHPFHVGWNNQCDTKCTLPLPLFRIFDALPYLDDGGSGPYKID